MRYGQAGGRGSWVFGTDGDTCADGGMKGLDPWLCLLCLLRRGRNQVLGERSGMSWLSAPLALLAAAESQTFLVVSVISAEHHLLKYFPGREAATLRNAHLMQLIF